MFKLVKDDVFLFNFFERYIILMFLYGIVCIMVLRLFVNIVMFFLFFKCLIILSVVVLEFIKM